jgi:hypothetical protein
MTSSLRLQTSAAQDQYVHDLSSAWSHTRLWDPSLWLTREPDIEEKMLRDADIAHALNYRSALIAGREWTVFPEEEGDKGQLAVDTYTQLLKGIRKFTEGRQLLARAFFHGARFSRIIGQTRVMKIGDGKPRTWWVPIRLQDMDKRSFRRVPDRADGSDRIFAHWERWHVGARKWVTETEEDALLTIRHVYLDDQATLGHGRALREALGWWWWAKTHILQESLVAAEKHGAGTLRMRIAGLKDAATALPNADLFSQAMAKLEHMRSRHVIVHDAEDDVDVIDGGGQGWQLLKELRDELKASIFTVVMGANLTTSADKGGSYALAEVQENSTEALIQLDRETLEETLTDDLLPCILYKNWPNFVEMGLDEEKVRVSLKQEKRQDPKERMEVATQLNAMGVDLAAEDLYEQAGYRKPTKGEDIIKGAEPMPDPFGGGGFGGGGFGEPPRNGNGNGKPAEKPEKKPEPKAETARS